MQPQRDEIDRNAIRRLARNWYEQGPSARRVALATFPELAAMGLALDDPCDAARAAHEEDVLRQSDDLGNWPGGDEPRQFADPTLRQQIENPSSAAAPARKKATDPDSLAAIREAFARRKRPTLPQTKFAPAYRDVARRRRVLAALAAEKELADGIGGHRLPDSEPADVIYLHDPLGNPITDPAHVKKALAVRAAMVERLKDASLPAAQRAFLEGTLRKQTAHAFEVKTLQTTARQYVQMNPKAVATKKAWSEKHAIPVHVVAFDKRRSGATFSGHGVYVAPNTVAPTTALARMKKVGNIGDVMTHVAGGTSVEPTKQQFADPPPTDPPLDGAAHARRQFEARIHASPFDATNRGVYADHLDEQGEHDEAAFQRGMGEWMRGKPFVREGSPEYESLRRFMNAYRPGRRVQWVVKRESALPGFRHVDILTNALPPNAEPGEHVPQVARGGDLGWRTYRGMEEAFRRAFMAGRQGGAS